MSTIVILTPTIASTEIARRALPKGDPGRTPPLKGTPAHAAFGLSGPELHAIAGTTPAPRSTPAPVQAPAKKASKPAALRLNGVLVSTLAFDGARAGKGKYAALKADLTAQALKAQTSIRKGAKVVR